MIIHEVNPVISNNNFIYSDDCYNKTLKNI